GSKRDWSSDVCSSDLPNAQLAIPATLPNACAVDVPTLTTAMAVPVQGYDQGANAPGCLADLRAGTDILVVRRASTCAVGAAGCEDRKSVVEGKGGGRG